MSKPLKTDLTPSSQTEPRPQMDERVLECQYGAYPWDAWERRAVALGLDAKMASYGRSVMREGYQHGWDEPQKRASGWRDDGQAMLTLALHKPKTARKQWEILLRTDGLRGDYKPRSTEWTWGYLRSDARQLLDQLERAQ